MTVVAQETNTTVPQTITHLFEVYIQASPEKIWQALTNGAMTQQYYFGTSVQSEWKVGSPYQYLLPDGNSMLNGEIVEIDPPPPSSDDIPASLGGGRGGTCDDCHI